MLRIAHNKYKQENKREKEWEKERGKEEREMSHGREADDEHKKGATKKKKKKGATQEGGGGDPLSAALLTKATEMISTTAFLQELFLAFSHLYTLLPGFTKIR